MRNSNPIPQIVDFGRRNGAYIDDNLETPKAQLEEVWRQLDNKKTLFILDDIKDADELTELLPSASDSDKYFTFIATSRVISLEPSIETYRLDLPSLEDALDQLKTFINSERLENEHEAVKEILGEEILDRLPLGIRLLGSYLTSDSKRKKESLSVTLERLRSKRKNWTPGRPGLIGDSALAYSSKLTSAQQGAGAAFDLTWELLESHTRKAAKLVCFFPPSFVDWAIADDALADGYKEFNDPDFESDRRDDARSKLEQHSLIVESLEEDEDDGYSYHPLIGDFFKSKT